MLRRAAQCSLSPLSFLRAARIAATSCSSSPRYRSRRMRAALASSPRASNARTVSSCWRRRMLAARTRSNGSWGLGFIAPFPGSFFFFPPLLGGIEIDQTTTPREGRWRRCFTSHLRWVANSTRLGTLNGPCRNHAEAAFRRSPGARSLASSAVPVGGTHRLKFR